jgi:hypothetical protein
MALQDPLATVNSPSVIAPVSGCPMLPLTVNSVSLLVPPPPSTLHHGRLNSSCAITANEVATTNAPKDTLHPFGIRISAFG